MTIARRFSLPHNLTSCTEKLRDNVVMELTFERAGDDDGFHLTEFLEAIEINTSVKRVSFSGTFARSLEAATANDDNDNNDNNHNNNTWNVVLSNIGKLKNLQELQIWCSNIPLDALGCMLSHARNLRKLYLFRVQFQGESFQPVCDALRGGGGAGRNNHHEFRSSLEDLRLAGFGGEEDAPQIDDLLEALAETNHLSTLHIQQNHPAPAPFGASSFQAVLTSQVLNELYLSRIGLEPSHVQVLVDSLPQSQLRMLNLFGNEISNVADICRILEHQSTLETLILPCCCGVSGSGNTLQQQQQLDEDQMAIASLIQVNTTLQNLHLPKSEFTDDGIEALASALTVNTTLRKCEIGVAEFITKESVQVIQNMLEQNYGLHKLIVKNLEIQQLAEFYSKLNGLGRVEILQTNDVRDWIEAITKITAQNDENHSDNEEEEDGLDTLYYFVRSNPGFLCHHPHPTTAATTTTSFPHQQRRRIKRQHSLCFVREPPTSSRSFGLAKSPSSLGKKDEHRRASCA